MFEGIDSVFSDLVLLNISYKSLIPILARLARQNFHCDHGNFCEHRQRFIPRTYFIPFPFNFLLRILRLFSTWRICLCKPVHWCKRKFPFVFDIAYHVRKSPLTRTNYASTGKHA